MDLIPPEVEDAHKTLGLSLGASITQVNTAYRKAALKWHPDHKGGTSRNFRSIYNARSVVLAYFATLQAEKAAKRASKLATKVPAPKRAAIQALKLKEKRMKIAVAVFQIPRVAIVKPEPVELTPEEKAAKKIRDLRVFRKQMADSKKIPMIPIILPTMTEVPFKILYDRPANAVEQIFIEEAEKMIPMVYEELRSFRTSQITRDNISSPNPYPFAGIKANHKIGCPVLIARVYDKPSYNIIQGSHLPQKHEDTIRGFMVDFWKVYSYRDDSNVYKVVARQLLKIFDKCCRAFLSHDELIYHDIHLANSEERPVNIYGKQHWVRMILNFPVRSFPAAHYVILTFDLIMEFLLRRYYEPEEKVRLAAEYEADLLNY